ncbi:hypothetical protein PSTT_13337 [Puccinia striiformis]|uniref:Uncharacterized protein n=1 Tax=Puccinia striiformis TaxID=27350 RepID=A0A2S4US88_9BASI|nr:hypothetical protein PSTT_13337 [Puccinia striiformis]
MHQRHHWTCGGVVECFRSLWN